MPKRDEIDISDFKVSPEQKEAGSCGRGGGGGGIIPRMEETETRVYHPEPLLGYTSEPKERTGGKLRSTIRGLRYYPQENLLQLLGLSILTKPSLLMPFDATAMASA